MKTFDVMIRATVRKTIRVEAHSPEEAAEQAHEEFSVRHTDEDEHYTEARLSVTEVREKT